MRWISLLITVSLVWLQGCAATGYQSGSGSITGGFYESEAPGDMVKISFSGNGFTESETAKAYTMYRAAEYTKEQGKSHFIAYRSLVDAANDYRAKWPAMGSIGGKPAAHLYIIIKDAPEKDSLAVEDVMQEYQSIVNPKRAKKTVKKNKQGAQS